MSIFDNFLTIINALIASCYNNEENVINETPYILLNDENKIFEFLSDVLNSIYNINDSLNKYFSYLIQLMQIDLNDLHSEALCRKSLDLIIKFLTNNKIDNDIILLNSPKFIAESTKLILLRNKTDYINSLLHSLTKTKLSNQLWHYTSECLIKILKFIIITNSTNWKKDINNTIWKNLISSYEQIFHQSELGYLNKCNSLQNQEELIRSCQELEISIINFIVNTLLPHSLDIPKDFQLKLLN